MDNFSQFNPHHRFTVGGHCLNMFNYFIDKGDEVRATAGRFHDVGKMLTQHFDDYGIAHYYSHDSVGAYYMLTHLDYFLEIDKNILIEILFYINYGLIFGIFSAGFSYLISYLHYYIHSPKNSQVKKSESLVIENMK